MNGPASRSARSRPTNRPIHAAVDHVVPASTDLKTSPGVGGAESGPPDEIANRCGTMALEIALSQFSDGFVSRQALRMRSTLLQERVGRLPSALRAAADDPEPGHRSRHPASAARAPILLPCTPAPAPHQTTRRYPQDHAIGVARCADCRGAAMRFVYSRRVSSPASGV